LPNGGRRKDALGIEMYDRARYFTVTGNRLPNTPSTIEHRDSELARLHAEIFGTEPCANTIAPRAKSQATLVSLDDAQIIAKAMRARNGDAFARLWNGDTTAHNGNHSDANLALCSHLAFWTGGNAVQIDRLFRQSGLMRPQ
jgi:primase-polymerase (primpol)-like protein